MADPRVPVSESLWALYLAMFAQPLEPRENADPYFNRARRLG